VATARNVVLVADTVEDVLRYLPLLTRNSLFSFHFLLSNLTSLFYQLSNDLPLPPPVEDIVLVTGAISAVLSYGPRESSAAAQYVVLIAMRATTALGDLQGIS